MRMNMKMERTAHGRTLNYEGFMRIMLMAFAVGMAGGAFAYNWTGGAGNLLLDDSGNWQSESSQTDRFIVNANPGGPLAVGGDGTFFNGEMLRYYGNFNVTNDFGAGVFLSNLGAKSGVGSAFHVENGMKLVQKSGGIRNLNTFCLSDNNTCFTLDGTDSWLVQEKGELAIRSQNKDKAGATPVCPSLFVTNGASLTVNTTLSVGAGGPDASAYACVAGAGTRLWANNLKIGAQPVSSYHPAFTNRFVVADSAEAIITNALVVGSVCANSGCEVIGGTVTVSNSFTLGNAAGASNCWTRISSGGTFTSRGTTAIGRSELGNNASLEVAGAGSSFAGHGEATLVGGTFRVSDGGTARMLGNLTITDGLIETTGTGASFSVNGDTTVSGAKRVSLSATDGGSINVARLNVGHPKNAGVGNAIVDGKLNYSTIYMGANDSELVLTNATVIGTRIEMTQSSTIRILDTHLTLTSNHFMMGDGDGSKADNNALRRDVYVGGADTWIKLLAGDGLTVRGSNTTVHVEIPAEGFSTSHPVFDIKKISFQTANHRLRVEVTAEPSKMNKGVRYTLFRCSAGNSCQSSQIDWIYDPNVIKIDTSVSGEVGVIVKNPGLMIFVR